MATNPNAPGVAQFSFNHSNPLHSGAENDERGEAMVADIEIRPWRFSDQGSLAKLPFHCDLEYPASASDKPRMMELIATKIRGETFASRRLFVALSRANKQRLGAIQCEQRGADDRWHLRYVLSESPVDHTNPVIMALLERAITHAGMRGARRIMASAEVESPQVSALRAVGFSAYCQHQVYVLPVCQSGTIDPSVKSQSKSDVWAVHQLYIQTTPRDVQNAEAFTSHEWDIDLEGRSRRGWYVAEDGAPVAFVRVHTTRQQHLLDVMVAPSGMQYAHRLLQSVLALLANEATRPVFIALRGYQQELDLILQSAGFERSVAQFMLVRYTTSPATARPMESFEMVKATKSKAQGVPSYYVRDAHE